MLLSFLIAHQEIDELFDAELVRVAQQMAGALPDEGAAAGVAASVPFASRRPAIHDGGSDVKDLLVVVWDRAGNRLPVAGRGANLLPHRPGLRGFVDLELRHRDLPLALGRQVERAPVAATQLEVDEAAQARAVRQQAGAAPRDRQAVPGAVPDHHQQVLDLGPAVVGRGAARREGDRGGDARGRSLVRQRAGHLLRDPHQLGVEQLVDLLVRDQEAQQHAEPPQRRRGQQHQPHQPAAQRGARAAQGVHADRSSTPPSA